MLVNHKPKEYLSNITGRLVDMTVGSRSQTISVAITYYQRVSKEQTSTVMGRKGKKKKKTFPAQSAMDEI